MSSDADVPDPDDLPVDPASPHDAPVTSTEPAQSERVHAPGEAGKADEHLTSDLPEDPPSAAKDLQSGSGIGTTDTRGS